MTSVSGSVTVGVDIGTTSVKALAVDGQGQVVARARVPHRIVTPGPDRLEHDARRAWLQGPRRAFGGRGGRAGRRRGRGGGGLDGALDHRGGPAGDPLLPGVLYGDARGERPPGAGAGEGAGTMPGVPDVTGMLRWAVDQAPGAAGYWPCQALATYALSGVAAIDTATTSVFGDLWGFGGWQAGPLGALGVAADQLPMVVPMGQPAATLAGSDAVIAGGTIDARATRSSAARPSPATSWPSSGPPWWCGSSPTSGWRSPAW